MFLLAQVDMGIFEHVDYKFFVKGHTKNSCDRSSVTFASTWLPLSVGP
ncbi:hypothetical protein PC128_g21130 [Phytophthora cactorum]|nr:hypothetical protein PC128_g21130 [Phytophthora cactorum]KAG4037234.1 hypothetical protein PC123_g27200 [Phytophthora cactorum]